MVMKPKKLKIRRHLIMSNENIFSDASIFYYIRYYYVSMSWSYGRAYSHSWASGFVPRGQK